MKLLLLSLATLSFTLLTAAAADSPFVGTWDTNWGNLVIEQKQEKFTGKYVGKFSGTIEGTIKEGKLHFTWKQPNAEWGSGVFTISEDGKSLKGTWGGAESATNGGPWDGKRKK
ncbi:MAG: hypothetical protein P1U87_20150 [Verrucomicrobiales bacterium]|nr:hypothetical protein [Verrucomicrobiales bacterium]